MLEDTQGSKTGFLLFSFFGKYFLFFGKRNHREAALVGDMDPACSAPVESVPVAPPSTPVSEQDTAIAEMRARIPAWISRNPERLQFVDDGGCGVLRLAVAPRRESDISDPYILRTDANRREQRVCSWFIGLHHPLLPSSSLRRILRVWPLRACLDLDGHFIALTLPATCPPLPCPSASICA